MANEESDDTVYNRYYTTIEVEKGDTLVDCKNLLSPLRYVGTGIRL